MKRQAGEHSYDNQPSRKRSVSRHCSAESPERADATLTLHQAQSPRPAPGIPGWLPTDPRLFSRVLLSARSAADAAVRGVSTRTGSQLWQAGGLGAQWIFLSDEQ